MSRAGQSNERHPSPIHEIPSDEGGDSPLIPHDLPMVGSGSVDSTASIETVRAAANAPAGTTLSTMIIILSFS